MLLVLLIAWLMIIVIDEHIVSSHFISNFLWGKVLWPPPYNCMSYIKYFCVLMGLSANMRDICLWFIKLHANAWGRHQNVGNRGIKCTNYIIKENVLLSGHYYGINTSINDGFWCRCISYASHICKNIILWHGIFLSDLFL